MTAALRPPFKIARMSRDRWIARRRHYIGGSEVAGLFSLQAEESDNGLPKYVPSAFALYQIKSGGAPDLEVTGERPQWGLALEGPIGQAAAAEEGLTLVKGGYVTHPRIKGMACSLDFAARFPDGSWGPLECKNVDWLAHRRHWTNDEPPLHVILQLQHQLACTGAARGLVACLVGGNHLETYHYQAAPKTIAAIEQQVGAFWDRVERRQPPPVDGSRVTEQTLQAMFPRRDPLAEYLELTRDETLAAACQQYLAAVERRTDLQKVMTAARNVILSKVGVAPGAIAKGFVVHMSEVEEAPPMKITPEMVGTVIGGRAGYRTLQVKVFQ